jgi:hypothetical protein
LKLVVFSVVQGSFSSQLPNAKRLFFVGHGVVVIFRRGGKGSRFVVVKVVFRGGKGSFSSLLPACHQSHYFSHFQPFLSCCRFP